MLPILEKIQCNSGKVKLANSQLDKSKSAAKSVQK